MEWNFEAHQKSTIADILATDLPDEERRRFKEWSQEVCTEDFNRLIETWFSEDVIKDKVAGYIVERIEELSHFTGAHIAALVEVNGRQFDHGCFNESLHV
jgi:hypothetical protein